MAKFYFGDTPLLGQPRRGGSKMGRIYIGGQLAYGEGPTSIPPLISEASVYYSANQGSTWDDLTGNGYNGTESYVGSGGGASIDYVGGNDAYWEFKAPNETVERPHLDTNFAKNNTDPYTITAVVQWTDLASIWQGVMGYSDPAGNPSFQSGQNLTDRWFVANRGASSGNNLFTYASTILAEDTWYFLTYTGDSNGIEVFTNNVSDGTDTSNGVTYADSSTLSIGRNLSLISTYKNAGKMAHWAFFDNKVLTSAERTELYDYYNEIYSF